MKEIPFPSFLLSEELLSFKKNLAKWIDTELIYNRNTKNENMKFFFEVILPKDLKGKIEIVKPKKAFTVVPNVKKKKIVVLRTYDELSHNEREDTIIPITIRAYALGHEDKIVVFRKATFTFPRLDIIAKHK